MPTFARAVCSVPNAYGATCANVPTPPREGTTLCKLNEETVKTKSLATLMFAGTIGRLRVGDSVRIENGRAFRY